MHTLLAIGIAILGFTGAPHHQRYWWTAADNCTVGTIERAGVWRGRPGVICTAIPAGWHTTPQPPMNMAEGAGL